MTNFCPNCSKTRKTPLVPDPSIKGDKYFPRDFVCIKCEKKILKEMSKPVEPFLIYVDPIRQAEDLGYQVGMEGGE